MQNRIRMAALIAAAGMAVPAMAQDSLSPTPGLANTDAVGAFDASEAANAYVVELSPIESSAGTVFGIAPIIKSNRVSSTFTTNLISAQTMSSTSLLVQSFPVQQYAAWTGVGPGVNNQINTQPDLVTPTGASYQLGVAFADFGTTNAGGNFNGIVGGLINIRPEEPTRLYVTRVNTAVNSADGSLDCAQYGIGAVDASGNVAFRADNNAILCGGGNPISGNNIFRVDLEARIAAGGLNVVDGSGGGAGTTGVIRNSGTTYNVPNIVPEALAGRPMVIGSNFARQYAYEATAGSLTTTTSHLGGAVDHRGAVGYSSARFFGTTTIGTAGVVSQTSSGSGATRQSVSIWGVGANGAPVSPGLITIPATTITNPTTGESINGSMTYYTNFFSQTPFRGGTAQVALGADAQGRLLVAGTADLEEPNLPDNFRNAIVAARLDSPNDASVEWSVAASVQINLNTGTVVGSPFYDANGERVGSLRPLFQITGAAPIGPSFSSPVIDSAGNIWFLAPFQNEVFDPALGEYVCRPNQNGDCSDSTGLFRAVYDPATFGYRLELVLSNGAEIFSENTQRNFKIIFISIADNNSIDSATLYSSNGTQAPYAGADLGQLEPSDPETQGGLVLQASIIYDVNDDGAFESLTGANGNPNSPDQNYSVLLFIGGAPFGGGDDDCNGNDVPDADEIAANPALDCFAPGGGGGDGVLDACQCIANFNGDAAVDASDITGFLTTWFADRASGGAQLDADVNCSGATDASDITGFLSFWFEARSATPDPLRGCP